MTAPRCHDETPRTRDALNPRLLTAAAFETFRGEKCRRIIIIMKIYFGARTIRIRVLRTACAHSTRVVAVMIIITTSAGAVDLENGCTRIRAQRCRNTTRTYRYVCVRIGTYAYVLDRYDCARLQWRLERGAFESRDSRKDRWAGRGGRRVQKYIKTNCVFTKRKSLKDEFQTVKI